MEVSPPLPPPGRSQLPAALTPGSPRPTRGTPPAWMRPCAMASAMRPAPAAHSPAAGLLRRRRHYAPRRLPPPHSAAPMGCAASLALVRRLRRPALRPLRGFRAGAGRRVWYAGPLLYLAAPLVCRFRKNAWQGGLFTSEGSKGWRLQWDGVPRGANGKALMDTGH